MAGGDVCSSDSFNEDISVFSKQVQPDLRYTEGKEKRLNLSHQNTVNAVKDDSESSISIESHTDRDF